MLGGNGVRSLSTAWLARTPTSHRSKYGSRLCSVTLQGPPRLPNWKPSGAFNWMTLARTGTLKSSAALKTSPAMGKMFWSGLSTVSGVQRCRRQGSRRHSGSQFRSALSFAMTFRIIQKKPGPHNSLHSVTTVHLSSNLQRDLQGCVLHASLLKASASLTSGQCWPVQRGRVSRTPPPHSAVHSPTTSFVYSQGQMQACVLQATVISTRSVQLAPLPPGGGSMRMRRLSFCFPPPQRAEQLPQPSHSE
mmetsp:Transcript_28444/g.81436  ORF Transcript_28444/g.81436 Transcript_28444/m.81436 type:complete len:248 (+) Transcript_28444:597-1340(+)